MSWIDAKTRQPENEQEVLVRIRGFCSTAVYDQKVNGYRLRDGSVCMPRFDHIEWLPSDKKN